MMEGEEGTMQGIPHVWECSLINLIMYEKFGTWMSEQHSRAVSRQVKRERGWDPVELVERAGSVAGKEAPVRSQVHTKTTATSTERLKTCN